MTNDFRNTNSNKQTTPDRNPKQSFIRWQQWQKATEKENKNGGAWRPTLKKLKQPERLLQFVCHMVYRWGTLRLCGWRERVPLFRIQNKSVFADEAAQLQFTYDTKYEKVSKKHLKKKDHPFRRHLIKKKLLNTIIHKLLIIIQTYWNL